MTREETNAAVEKMLIPDEEFTERLQDTIKPWVKEHLKEEYFTSYDGTKIHTHYAIHPQEKASIVISHGFCEFAGKFHEVMYYMYTMGYSVFFIEHRGHGFSDRAACIHEWDRVYVKNYDEYVEDMHGFIEKIVKKRSLTHTYYLYAHSMGGAISALFLEKYPDVFERAVLSSPMLQLNFGKNPTWLVKVLMVVSKILRWDLKYAPGQKGFNHVYVFKTSSSTSEPRYAYIFNQREETPQYTSYGGTYAWTRASIYATRKIARNADKVKIPVLLCQAGKDTMVRPEGQEYFAEHSKNTRLIRFPESKHELFTATYDIMLPYYKEVFDFYAEK